MDHLCGSHTIQTVTNQLCHSLTASNASFLSHPIGPDVRISPLLQLPGGTCTTLRYRSNPTHSALPSPFSLLPIKLCMDLYIPFQWSGIPVSIQLVLCEICICRCVPDASVEREVLHVHLLLHYLVSLKL